MRPRDAPRTEVDATDDIACANDDLTADLARRRVAQRFLNEATTLSGRQMSTAWRRQLKAAGRRNAGREDRRQGVRHGRERIAGVLQQKDLRRRVLWVIGGAEV